MNVGLVGANSAVATELAFVLRENGHRVTPVVRNELGSSFLDGHGFECRIGDITVDDDAPSLLTGMDVVAIPAFASYRSRAGAQPRRAKRINEAIVENAIEYSADGAIPIYFSTITAFGSRIDIADHLRMYSRLKRHAEGVFEDVCAREARDGYTFRLGHVIGENQSLTRLVRDQTRSTGDVFLRVPADRLSNVVHVVTVAEAVVDCGRAEVPPGRYTVVNEPQWTWHDVFDHYSTDGTTLHFSDTADASAGSASPLSRLLEMGWDGLLRNRETLRPAHFYVPEPLNERLRAKHRRSEAGDEIRRLVSGIYFHTHEFEYRPAPGRFLDGLTETRVLLPEDYGFSAGIG